MNILSFMNVLFFPRYYLRLTHFPAAASLILLLGLQSASVATAQEASRDVEARKEAGRLATEAEQIRGEAHQQVRAGGDRKLIREAEQAAVEKFRQALELWRAAGDEERVAAASEEISRIYMVLKDHESAIGVLRREAEFWRERNDVNREVRATWLIGIRQMQMRKDEAAIKTMEEVIEKSRAANLIDVEANTLYDLAGLYGRVGRSAAAAARLKARAEELREQIHSSAPVEVKKAREPLKLPAQWLDLPAAPLVAEYREIEGVRQAVLVNRSAKGIEMVLFGCVEERDGVVRVVGPLGGMGLNHGGVGPGNYYEAFTYLNSPQNRWTDEKMHCQKSAKMAVVQATYADRTQWEAEGTDWTKGR